MCLCFLNQCLNLIKQSRHLEIPENFEVVVYWVRFNCHEARQARKHIEEEGSLNIAKCNLLNRSCNGPIVFSGGYELSRNVSYHYQVEHNFEQSLLLEKFKMEGYDIWEVEEGDQVEDVGEHIPYLLVTRFTVDDEPLDCLSMFVVWFLRVTVFLLHF